PMSEKRASWSGQLAFVLAAAASAIGLGNLWRFPYLAAQYGGGTFIAIYLGLVVTLGFTLMVTEISIGRMTAQSQLTAYARLHGGWGLVGLLGTIIPLLLTPYYCVIGGWVLKYLVAYARMAFTGAAPMGTAAADSGAFFNSFISAPFAPFGYGMLFAIACACVIVLGVKNGIERSNMVMMPILFLMAVAISIYVICLPGTGDGLRYYLVPNMDCLRDSAGRFSPALLGKTILGAMGQMFYSLSLAMGIMITYGSYMKKTDSIERCVRRIEIFDTLIAVVAGLMIIPVVYMFAVKTGTPVKEAMNAGPGLMFITLPKVFATLGATGPWLGLTFFVLVLFAAATSAISLFEACVASVCDLLKLDRKSATFFTGALIMFLATFSAVGYGPWADVRLFGMQFLDFFDFATNSVLMPVVAAATCVFVGYVLGPRAVIDECQAEGAAFRAKGLYVVMVKYFAPVLVVAILVSEICRTLGIGGWKI
ncbi:MAG: sodium-dependent transporter, partial [Fibrobacterales bacterium]|nr:sodium-dependent transporter [Fibrobacterales bacterium]